MTVPRRISHRALPGAIAACLLLLGTACESEQPTPATERAAPAPPAQPNLVLITLDTVRSDALGAYGQTAPTSPRIDRLAAQGVLFERVSSSNPETLPSHATIFTGRWPHTHGVRANAGYVLAEPNLSLAEHLAAQGYATGAEVAARVLSKTTGITQGFALYRSADSPGVKRKRVARPGDPGNPQTTDAREGSDISARGVEFIRANRSRPFFLWLHYFDAHFPYAPPVAFRRRIPDNAYHAEVASADFQVGLVIDALEQLGLAERTLVVVTSDHGEGLGDHGEDTHAYFVYDSTMRVPLVLWGLADLPRGRRIPALARTVDIAPTALDLMGQPPLAGAQGASLAPLVRGETSDPRRTGYGEAHQLRIVFGLPVLRFVEKGRWKYIHKVNPELYDVEHDPAERTNLAPAHPEVVEELRAELAELLREAPGAPEAARVPVGPERAAQLRALGYVAEASESAPEATGESLALFGDDPRNRVADIKALAVADQHLADQDDRAGRSLEVLARMYERGQLDAIHMNNYAWALATSPNPRLRDGPKALEVIRRAMERIDTPDPGYLDTLAAAQAASGQLEEAARTAAEALRLAESMGADAAILEQLRSHLAAFERGEAL